jgi:GDP-L-fucose synthase
MRILLTGSRGMLGSSLMEHLATGGFEVLSPTSIELNLLNQSAVDEYLKRNKPETIIHAAARVGGIQANIDSPYEYLSENIRMDSNLFSAAKELGVANFVYMASSCMYPRKTKQPMGESQILTGELEPTNEGYALAKIIGTKTVETANKQYGLNWHSLILSNLFGPRDHFNSEKSHLLAAIITKVESAKRLGQSSISMWGTGQVRREFTYVHDVSKFISSNLATLNQLPASLNIGAGQDFSVLEYYKMVSKYAGYEGDIVPDASKPEGMAQKLMNIEVAKEFGWNPETSMTDAIAQTYDWYLESLQGEK